MKTRPSTRNPLYVVGLVITCLLLTLFLFKPANQITILNVSADVLGRFGALYKSNDLRYKAERIENNHALITLAFANPAEYEAMSNAVWEGYDKKTKYLQIRRGKDDWSMEVTVDSAAEAWARRTMLDALHMHRKSP